MTKKHEIVVNGTGSTTSTPDFLILDCGVTVLDQSIVAATARAAEQASSLIESLERTGVDRPDIATRNYDIHAEYEYSDRERRFVGFRVNNHIQVRIREIESAGAVIDEAVSTAGDELTVDGLRFEIEDPATALAEARQHAWQDAQSKATQLAQLGGRQLGQVLSITETNQSHAPAPVAMEFARSAKSTPIEPGQQTLSVSITVRFDLVD